MGAPPKRNVAVDEVISGAFGGEFDGCNGKRDAVVEAVREEESLRVVAERDGQRSGVVGLDAKLDRPEIIAQTSAIFEVEGV